MLPAYYKQLTDEIWNAFRGHLQNLSASTQISHYTVIRGYKDNG